MFAARAPAAGRAAHVRAQAAPSVAGLRWFSANPKVFFDIKVRRAQALRAPAWVRFVFIGMGD